MAENRTNKLFRSEFRKSNQKGNGFIGGTMYIPNKEDLKKKQEGIARSQLQLKIRDLIKDRYSEEKIKQSLKKEEYKNFQSYIDKWIENWLMKLNPSLKIRIIQLLTIDANKEKVLEIIHSEYKEIFELYETTIKQAVEAEIELRKEKNKEEEERQ